MDAHKEFIRAIVREVIAELLPHLRGADDELLLLDVAGELVTKTARAIRDAGRRGELEIVTVGRSPRVRRSALLAWAKPVEIAAPATDVADEVNASLVRAADRFRKVG